MSDLRGWSLACLAKLEELYKSKVSKGMLSPGVLFLMRETKHSKTIPKRLIPVTELMGMTPTQEADFWKGLGGQYEKVISKHFPERAVMVQYGSSWFVSFRTDGWDEQHKAADPARMYDEAMKTEFTFIFQHYRGLLTMRPVPMCKTGKIQ
jgi:hypothetical protein